MHPSYPAPIGAGTRGSGCPLCNESKGEKAVRDVLTRLNINFVEQYIFQERGLLKDDFALTTNDGVVIATIEYNREQHYKPVDFQIEVRNGQRIIIYLQ